MIVDPSANLDLAVPSIAKGGFYHWGQVCVSVQRVFAHASIVDELTDSQSNKNRECVGQGVANIASPLFGGIPAMTKAMELASSVMDSGPEDDA